MNITYIIGNGFDINIGLNTSYQQFLLNYINSKSENENYKVIDWFKNELNDDLEKWSDAELEFGKFTSKINIDNLDSGKVFEICYKDFVESFCVFLELEQNRIENDRISSDICQQFCSGIKNYYKGLRRVDRENLVDHYNTVGGAEAYNIISFNYTNIFETIYNKCQIYNIGLGLRNNNSSLKNFLMQPMNAHGTLNDNTVVFGVDNSKQILDESIFSNCHRSVKDLFVKSTADETIGELIDKSSNDILQRSNLIYIYGCSLGETDKTWWNRIIKLLKEKNEARVIMYSHELKKFSALRTRIDKEEKIDNIKYNLLKHSDFEKDFNDSSLINKIYVTDEDIFDSFANSIQEILKK